jgi:uncharacterized SAM-binding protein YcdF (DUF218 family)
MSEFLASLDSITGVVVGLLIGVVWLWIAPASRGPRRWLTALLVASLVVSVGDVNRLLSWPLRRRFHSFSKRDAPPGPYAIVLLGAGARTTHGQAQRIGVLSLPGAARVLEAARVFRVLGQPFIVSSGGAPGGRHMIAESEVMKGALVELGVPAEKILLESESAVTRDEAVVTARMLRELGITTCILVTTDVHMPRALGTFRHEGLQVVPAIALSPYAFQDWPRSWLPTPEGLKFSQEVVHEYVGLAWYALRGWL